MCRIRPGRVEIIVILRLVISLSSIKRLIETNPGWSPLPHPVTSPSTPVFPGLYTGYPVTNPTPTSHHLFLEIGVTTDKTPSLHLTSAPNVTQFVQRPSLSFPAPPLPPPPLGSGGSVVLVVSFVEPASESRGTCLHPSSQSRPKPVGGPTIERVRGSKEPP